MAQEADTAFERRLLALERRQLDLDALAARIRREAVEAFQKLTGVIATDSYVPAAPPPASGIDLYLTVTGCNGLGVNDGITIRIKDNASGATLGFLPYIGSGTSNDGSYGMVNFPGVVAGQVIDYVTSGPRWTTDTQTGFTLTAGTNLLDNVAVSPTSGYVCLALNQLGFGTPVKKTLTMTSAKYGTFNCDWNVPTGNWKTAALTLNFPAGDGCPAATAVPVTYRLATNVVLLCTYKAVNAVNQCPSSAGANFIANGGTLSSSSSPISVPGFHLTYDLGGKWSGVAVHDTITLVER